MKLYANTMKRIVLLMLLAVISTGFSARSAAAEPMAHLIRDAHSASGAKRLQAVEALGKSGDLRALQPLLGLLHDADPSIRDYALKALNALTQSLRQIYTHLAQWIDNLRLRLEMDLAPEPPVERTQARRVTLI